MPAFDDAEQVEQLELSDPIAVARRRHRTAGAMLAAGMLGLEQALGLRKPKEEAPIVIDASDDPLDIDRDGMSFAVDNGTSVFASPQPRSEPLLSRRRRRRR